MSIINELKILIERKEDITIARRINSIITKIVQHIKNNITDIQQLENGIDLGEITNDESLSGYTFIVNITDMLSTNKLGGFNQNTKKLSLAIDYSNTINDIISQLSDFDTQEYIAISHELSHLINSIKTNGISSTNNLKQKFLKKHKKHGEWQGDEKELISKWMDEYTNSHEEIDAFYKSIVSKITQWINEYPEAIQDISKTNFIQAILEMLKNDSKLNIDRLTDKHRKKLIGRISTMFDELKN